MSTTPGEGQPKRATGAVRNATVFASEFVHNFHTTGAIAPSGKTLARALSRHLHTCPADGPRRLLEVGPGTGGRSLGRSRCGCGPATRSIWWRRTRGSWTG
ncbi:hypothetical protein [Fodinicola feengrottensis]|uniref:hypothetical protein n=1 Tax=Fodinicola feengrottensis TaxID=435914 RepID=UPI0013D15714|nr:hypothetical protein [Fodinicola feengrottensis]